MLLLLLTAHLLYAMSLLEGKHTAEQTGGTSQCSETVDQRVQPFKGTLRCVKKGRRKLLRSKTALPLCRRLNHTLAQEATESKSATDRLLSYCPLGFDDCALLCLVRFKTGNSRGLFLGVKLDILQNKYIRFSISILD